MLTKDDMLVALHDAITEDQEFELADEIMDAMELYDQPFDLVAPHFRLYFQASRSRFWGSR